MVAKLSLWILGPSDQDPFVVDILPSESVDHLKKAIKKEQENALDCIDANWLDIWKVNSPAQRTRH